MASICSFLPVVLKEMWSEPAVKESLMILLAYTQMEVFPQNDLVEVVSKMAVLIQS